MKVYNSRGLEIEIDTSKELGSGGEGIIYQLSRDKVAKIYHPHIKPAINQNFLDELSKLNGKFIKPIDLFYNKSKGIVGFSMNYLDMHKLHAFSDLFSKAVCNKEGYNDKFKIKVINSLAESVEEAHNKGIVIGDLNPYNLLFTDQGDVYFIDTDSYQTKNRPHSGIMLPDIRDWINHKIDKYSDYYSLSVLAFNVSTFVHPYKGVHKHYKSIEERVLRHLSLLSGSKDIIIPSFYEPISSSNVSNQMYEIFQDDRRFLIDINGLNTIKKSIPLVTTTLIKSLAIKQIQDHVKFYTLHDNDQLIFVEGKENNSYSGLVHGTVSLVTKGAKIINPKFQSNGLYVDFNQFDNTYTISNVDGFQSFKGNIFVPSLTKGDGVLIQSISGQKWLLWAMKTGLVTLRTQHDIRNAYKRDKYLCLQIKQGNKMKYYLAGVNGLSLDLGEELDGMRAFCVVGGNVFVPEDKRIDVYSSLRKIAEIQCDYVTENSILGSCSAGIICQTDDKLMLINKS